jgi:hypothetical protein
VFVKKITLLRHLPPDVIRNDFAPFTFIMGWRRAYGEPTSRRKFLSQKSNFS